MSTMQDLCDFAREPLNDDAKTRYPDTTLLKHANTGIGVAYKIRPDLRFGAYATEFVPLVLGDTFPLPEQFRQVIADFMVFRCTLKDGEANAGRAAEFMALFEKEVMTL